MPILHEPDSVYHARKEISNSMLSDVHPPYRYWAKHISEEISVPGKQSDAMDEGAAMHMVLLEPQEFENRFAISPKFDRRTKQGKSDYAKFELENQGKTIIDQSQADTVMRMAEAVHKHPAALELLTAKAAKEVTVLFDYQDTDIKCRGRIDTLIPDMEVIVDLKRSRDSSPRGFQRAIANYQYHRQGTWYCDGLASCGDERFAGASDWPFIWIAIEPEPPYCVGVYTMDDKQRDEARLEYQRRMQIIQDCLKSGEWPHYTKQIEIMHLPEWAYSNFEPTEVIV